MNKIYALMIAGLFVASCSGGGGDSSTTPTPTTTQPQPQLLPQVLLWQ